MIAETGSRILSTFISGMRLVFLLMAILQFISSIGHLTTSRAPLSEA
jgi:hypothetical protein